MNTRVLFVITLVPFLFPATISHAQWKPVPSLTRENPVAFLSVAAQGDTIFVGGYQGDGMYRSTDNGVHWSEVGSEFEFRFMNTIVIDNGTVYAANYSGVYHSTDWGTTWLRNVSGLPARANITGLAVAGPALFCAAQGSVYRSFDGGTTWVSHSTGLPATYMDYYCIAAFDTLAFLGSEDGIFRSSVHGAHWVPANTGLPKDYADTPPRINKIEVTGGNLFAASDGYGIFLSTDQGLTWTLRSTGLPTNTYNPPYYKSVYSLGHNEAKLYAGTDDGALYASTNLGFTWYLACDSISSIVYLFDFAFTGREILVATFTGLYRSNGSDSLWIPILTTYPKLVVPHSIGVTGDKIYVSGQSDSWNGSFLETDWTVNRGKDWILDAQLKQGYSFTFTTINDGFYAFDPGIFRSTDGGNHWTERDSGLPGDFVNALTTYKNLLFAGTGYDYWQWGEFGGVYHSTDLGNSWSLRGLADTAVLALCADHDRLYAGTLHGIFLSVDSGVQWTSVSNGLPRFSEILQIVKFKDALFALDAWSGIYLSSDDGAHWSSTSDGLPIDSTRSFSVRGLFNLHNRLLAAARNGVYLLAESGTSWLPFSDGLQGSGMWISCMAADSDYLYCGNGAGLWYRNASEITSVTAASVGSPASFRLDQNYPNPFNPTTTIRYSLPAVQHVTLRVYDILGREIRTLVDNIEGPGLKSVTFDARHISSGIYYYRVTTATFNATKAMVIMK